MAAHPGWKDRIGLAACVWLGLVLVVAAIGKVADPLLFVQQIRNEGLEGILSANTVALTALALEIGLGVALILGVRTAWVLVPTAALVGFFLFLTGRNYLLVLQGLRDPNYDCGCFGILWERTAVEAFWQDLLILVPPLLVAAWSQRFVNGPLPGKRIVAAGVAAVAVVLVTAFGVGLPPPLAFLPEEDGSAGSFQQSRDYAFVSGGEVDDSVPVYYSEGLLQFLIVPADSAGPILLDVRSQQVFRYPPEAVQRFADGSRDISPTDEASGSRFAIGVNGLSFELEGRQFEIRNRIAP